MDWYARCEKVFKITKKTVKIGLVLIPPLLIIFLATLVLTNNRTLIFLSLILLLIPAHLVWYGLWLLVKLRLDFMQRSQIRPAAIALNKAGGPILFPKFRVFFSARNLREFESGAVKDLRRFTKKLVDAKRKLEQLEYELQKLKDEEKRHVELKEFEEVLNGVESEEELESYLKRYENAKVSSEVRALINELEYKLWERKNSQNRFEEKIKDLNRILEESAGDDLCDSARRLLQEAELALEPKMKIRYLKAAITEQKKANKVRVKEKPDAKKSTIAAS